MADSVAAALNTLAKETLTLPREDEEQLQLFIADFFTTPDDYDDYSSGINYNEFHCIIKRAGYE